MPYFAHNSADSGRRHRAGCNYSLMEHHTAFVEAFHVEAHVKMFRVFPAALSKHAALACCCACLDDGGRPCFYSNSLCCAMCVIMVRSRVLHSEVQCRHARSLISHESGSLSREKGKASVSLCLAHAQNAPSASGVSGTPASSPALRAANSLTVVDADKATTPRP